MSLPAAINEDYALRSQASFAGIPFGCESASERSGKITSTETRVGVGQRSIAVANRLKSWPMTGYITGADARARGQRMRAALDRNVPQTLVHPWRGRLQAIAEDVDWTWNAPEIQYATFVATFVEASFPAVPPAQDAPQTSGDALARLEKLGEDFAGEPASVDQWVAIAPDLGLDPDPPDSDFTRKATAAALESPAAMGGDIPTAVQATGQAVRRADTGELDRESWQALDRELLLVANRHNSPTIWRYRQVLVAFLGPDGAASLAKITTADGATLIGIAAAEGVDPGVIARNNRLLARSLFARGDIQR